MSRIEEIAMKPQDDTPQREDTPAPKPPKPDPKTGIDSEVGDLDDSDAGGDDALPGRAGGGLAGA